MKTKKFRGFCEHPSCKTTTEHVVGWSKAMQLSLSCMRFCWKILQLHSHDFTCWLHCYVNTIAVTSKNMLVCQVDDCSLATCVPEGSLTTNMYLQGTWYVLIRFVWPSPWRCWRRKSVRQNSRVGICLEWGYAGVPFIVIAKRCFVGARESCWHFGKTKHWSIVNDIQKEMQSLHTVPHTHAHVSGSNMANYCIDQAMYLYKERVFFNLSSTHFQLPTLIDKHPISIITITYTFLTCWSVARPMWWS